MSTAEANDLQEGQNLAHLLPPSWREVIPQWFAEDTPSFDWAGFVVGEDEQEAILWGKSGVRGMHGAQSSSNDRAWSLASHSSRRSSNTSTASENGMAWLTAASSGSCPRAA